MLLKEIFAADVTRDIPPVVYFHQQDAAKVAEEVSEYIITGGYPEDDPRHHRVPDGIHEQLIRLITGLTGELRRSGGGTLPACWISGFYGSGKSSFAKLIGLALDGLRLPDNTPLADALIARDHSPRADELRGSWDELRALLDPFSVVFDIGSVARTGVGWKEDIHLACKRQLQRRLGYCPRVAQVAQHEIKLEQSGQWDAFTRAVEEVHGQSWAELVDDPLVDELFSEVMHELHPGRYTDPMSWYDVHAGKQPAIGTSVEETVQTITHMLDQRAPGKTLFFVVDEVSQYVHQDDNRMLALQSFVTDLGQRLQGRAWLLATGQQKLEDDASGAAASSIGKLKDRFPARLRVHLASTNIRDVVYNRLLKKDPLKEDQLRAEFERHRSKLKLYGYRCDNISAEDFVEVYPLLPGHFDLLMLITTNLRSTAESGQTDVRAVRGLLQLVGDLFREHRLGERDLGALVTLDLVYDQLYTSLNADTQSTLSRLFSDDDVIHHPLAGRVAKAITLLQLIQERTSTTTELIARCLYERLGADQNESNVKAALEVLRSKDLISYSENKGWRIMSFAGQDWQRERDRFPVTSADRSNLILEQLKELHANTPAPRFKANRFPWSIFYNDARTLNDARVKRSSERAVVTLDLHFRPDPKDRADTDWIPLSAQKQNENRLYWLNGPTQNLLTTLDELARSAHMIERYEPRQQGLPEEKRSLLLMEQSRRLELKARAKQGVRELFASGVAYHRGKSYPLKNKLDEIVAIAETILPSLYINYIHTAITESELKQLLAKSLSGVSPKFLADGLGVFTFEGGSYTPSCDGDAPSRVARYIEAESAATGSQLLDHFGGPPYGYAPDIVKACVAGLVRAGRVRVKPEAGPDITSVNDPGGRDLFLKTRDFNRARFSPSGDNRPTPRERTKIRRFFQDTFGVQVGRELDAIADAAFQQLPALRGRLNALRANVTRLPRDIALPDELQRLSGALDECTSSRHIRPTALSVLNNLDALKDGIDALNTIAGDITHDAIEALDAADDILRVQAAQLAAINAQEPVQAAIDTLERHFTLSRPWRGTNALIEPTDDVRVHYMNVRQALIEEHDHHYKRALEAVRHHPDYGDLTHDKQDLVLKIVHRAVFDTTPNTTSPTLAQLKELGPGRLQDASKDAQARVESLVGSKVVEVDLKLSDRLIEDADDIKKLLLHIEAQLLKKLEPNTRIRLK